MTRVRADREDICFLPEPRGEDDAWMAPETLEVLNTPTSGGNGDARRRAIGSVALKIKSLNFMRGRTFVNNADIYAEEPEPKKMKTLVTPPARPRCLLGNVAQSTPLPDEGSRASPTSSTG